MNAAVKLLSPPGYGPVVPLDRKKHAGLGLKADRDYGWTAELNACFVNVVEFARAATDFPIAFGRDPRSGEFVPMAVLGLRKQQNLFVDAQGHWRAQTYIPAYFRRHPFCIAEVAATKDRAAQRMICVEEAALAPSKTPLFDASGEATGAWQPINQLLEAIEGARQATRVLTKRLESLDLLVPFDAIATPTGAKQMRLSGMFRVDEARLQNIAPKDLKIMLRKNELRFIYAHLISLENFARLMDLAVLRGE